MHHHRVFFVVVIGVMIVVIKNLIKQLHIKDIHIMSWQHAEKMRCLIELVWLNPAVRSCIQRIISEVVPPAVTISEGGKPLTPDLQRILGPWMSMFLENSIEMAFMCGFVVFVRRRHEGVNVPLLLPLGSFSWGVELVTERTKKRKREHPSLYRYSVRPHHPEIRADDIFVFELYSPALRDEFCLPSPLDSLCTLRSVIDMTERRMQQVLMWNSTKHITTSERVNIPKDSTTEGISLLDDFRRYLVTGQHLGISRNYMTMNGMRASIAENPMNLSSSMIRQQFDAGESANVHVLPPNTDVSELSSLELKTNMLELHDVMQRQVTEFFQMPMLTDMGGKDVGSFVQRQEVKQMRHMSNFSSRLLQFTYAAIFDVQENTVEVDLPEPSGMHINCAEDVKKLHESNTLLPSDRLKIRKRIMHNV